MTIPREKRKVTVEDAVASLLEAPIITPGETPMFTDDPDLLGTILGKRKREHGRNDPRKATRPELPISGPGKGGRVGASATQHVVQNLFRDSTREEDVSQFPFRLFSAWTRPCDVAVGGRLLLRATRPAVQGGVHRWISAMGEPFNSTPSWVQTRVFFFFTICKGRWGA